MGPVRKGRPEYGQGTGSRHGGRVEGTRGESGAGTGGEWSGHEGRVEGARGESGAGVEIAASGGVKQVGGESEAHREQSRTRRTLASAASPSRSRTGNNRGGYSV